MSEKTHGSKATAKRMLRIFLRTCLCLVTFGLMSQSDNKTLVLSKVYITEIAHSFSVSGLIMSLCNIVPAFQTVFVRTNSASRSVPLT